MKKLFFLIAFILPFSFVCFSQDSIHRYTDNEVIKIANHIKGLETKTASYLASHPNDVFVSGGGADGKNAIVEIQNDSLHRYTDREVIKIVKYIKYLEKADSLNTIFLAEAKAKRIADSLALVAKNEVHLKEENEIDKYEKQIYFNFASSVLKPEPSKALDDVITILKKYPKLTFVVEGHTDNVGSESYNMTLSKARAQSVKTYFVSKGIPETRITSIGYGKDKPVATNETEDGRAKNRRVEIKAKK